MKSYCRETKFLKVRNINRDNILKDQTLLSDKDEFTIRIYKEKRNMKAHFHVRGDLIPAGE